MCHYNHLYLLLLHSELCSCLGLISLSSLIIYSTTRLTSSQLITCLPFNFHKKISVFCEILQQPSQFLVHGCLVESHQQNIGLFQFFPLFSGPFLGTSVLVIIKLIGEHGFILWPSFRHLTMVQNLGIGISLCYLLSILSISAGNIGNIGLDISRYQSVNIVLGTSKPDTAIVLPAYIRIFQYLKLWIYYCCESSFSSLFLLLVECWLLPL